MTVTAYEQAVKLKQFCEQKLQAAQLKIEKIEIAPDGEIKTAPLAAMDEQ